MAEPSTVARPYAAALFEASTHVDDAQLVAQLDTLARLAADPALREFAASPKAQDAQVIDLIVGLAGPDLSPKLRNLLATVVENGRLVVLTEIAEQFRALVNQRAGAAEALIASAFPLDDAQRATLVQVLEKRFGRKLNAQIQIDPALIGGVCVTVGDEVLDTSVRARLERMRAALTY